MTGAPLFDDQTLARLATPASTLVDRFPVERTPAHVVYGGAHLFKANTVPRLGELARQAFNDYVPDGDALLAAFGGPSLAYATRLHERVLSKLQTEPVEDYRVDFEDGYGYRADDEEDADAVRTAEEAARAVGAGSLPPFFGIRVKALGRRTAHRALRTLGLYLQRLAAAGVSPPPGFVVTLPKVTSSDEVQRLCAALDLAEQRLGWQTGCLGVELMVETPESLLAADGRVPLRAFIEASNGRCRALHLGAYDLTASAEVAAPEQVLHHPLNDLARQLMQLAVVGTPVRVADGATNTLPIAPHRARDGAQLSPQQLAENQSVVTRAFRLAHSDIRRSLQLGIYQGWDLHPAQLIPRWVAVHGFFLEHLTPSVARLRAFLDKAAQATRLGDVFDDAATGQGLLNFCLRARAVGAVTDEELERAGIDGERLQSRSFMELVHGAH